MASRKKRLKKVLEEIKDSLLENLDTRISSVKYYRVPSCWISSHSEAIIHVEIKRKNKELINTIYDVLYKEMLIRNFDHIISLEVHDSEERAKSTEEGGGEILWKVV